MNNVRILAMSIACVVMSAPLVSAGDLSRYREFQLGQSLATVAQRAGITPEARIVHRRPALIQELMWQPLRASGSAGQGDSVSRIVFSFYNDHLFRIAVYYDREKTEGLTTEDMVEAVSATYGLAMLPATGILPSKGSGDGDKILARWDDLQSSLSLSSSYESRFGLVMFSKELDGLARAATLEAIRLDGQEAPQREIERQQKQTDEKRAKQEAARRANKATFRP